MLRSPSEIVLEKFGKFFLPNSSEARIVPSMRFEEKLRKQMLLKGFNQQMLARGSRLVGISPY